MERNEVCWFCTFNVIYIKSSKILVTFQGILDRSLVAGITLFEILFSHVITQFVVMCVQTALVLIFTILVFEITCNGDIINVIALTLLQGICGMCFGFVISAVCEVERNATQLALGSFYPIILMSGFLWPIEGMPSILKYVCNNNNKTINPFAPMVPSSSFICFNPSGTNELLGINT